MEITSKATLVDLLERLLDKGIVIQADLVICVAEIPLIGVNLRAVIAGMDTLRKFGMMQELDQEIRAAAKERQQSRLEAKAG